MVMVGQSKRLSEPLRWTKLGRASMLATAVLTVAAIATITVLAFAHAPKQRPGCIEVTFASTLGGAVVKSCGARAREACANPTTNPAAAAHGALREACRKAGLPYG